LLEGDEADEAAGADPAVSSWLMASWDVSSAIVDWVGILYSVRTWMAFESSSRVLSKGSRGPGQHFRDSSRRRDKRIHIQVTSNSASRKARIPPPKEQSGPLSHLFYYDFACISSK